MKTILSAFLLLFITSASFAAGACCSVIKGGNSKGIYLTLDYSTADNHEEFNNEEFQLIQSALNTKVNYSFGNGIYFSTHLGVPIRSKLTNQPTTLHHQNHTFTSPLIENKGIGGIIYGVGIGYGKQIGNLPLIASLTLSTSRSVGYLNEGVNGVKLSQRIEISELQIVALADYQVLSSFSTFGGIRSYRGNNKWVDKNTKQTYSDMHDWNVAPVLGVRYEPNSVIGIVLSGGMGHTRLYSLGFAMNVSKLVQ